MIKWERISEHEWRAVTAGLAVTVANGYIDNQEEYKVSCVKLGFQHRLAGTNNLTEAQARAEVILLETIADRIRAVANLNEGK